jgi:sugar lactone lactonase YvrE
MPRFRPEPWTPPPTPALEGDYAENDLLASADLWAAGGEGPEDVVVDDEGWLFTGLADGRIRRLAPDGSKGSTVAVTGGRPLGVELHPDGGLVVCDADLGLLHVGGDGTVRTWVADFEGERLVLTNNASVAADGTVYFTETSRRWGLGAYDDDILEQSATGRLFARHPDGSVEVLLDGLAFANGVALAGDGSAVFVAETARYRIQRVDLGGGRAGEASMWVENLPGFPDNLTSAGGIVWVAMPRPRDRLLDRLIPSTAARRAIRALPSRLKPKPSRRGFVVGLDERSGAVVHNLQDPTGRVAVTTSARVAHGNLYVGSLTEPSVAVLPLPPPGPPR